MNEFTYKGTSLKNGHGRGIDLQFQPNRGLIRFEVAGTQVVWSADALEPLAFPVAAGRVTDNLEITQGDVKNFTFPDIDLRQIHTRVNHQFKTRRVCWAYDTATINKPGFGGPTLQYDTQYPPTGGPLAGSYMIGLGGSLEQPLAVEAVMTDVASWAFRYAVIVTGAANSPLCATLAMHTAWNATRSPFTGFTVNFSKGAVKIDPSTLEQIEVVQRAGLDLDDPLPPLTGFTYDVAPSSVFSGKVTATDLLNAHRHQRREGLNYGETVEVLTVVLKAGVRPPLNLI